MPSDFLHSTQQYFAPLTDVLVCRMHVRKGSIPGKVDLSGNAPSGRGSPAGDNTSRLRLPKSTALFVRAALAFARKYLKCTDFEAYSQLPPSAVTRHTLEGDENASMIMVGVVHHHLNGVQ